MPSLLPDFEYDIFISYRHNDNRTGWVTDFANALQQELAATIKEPLSIYFDKNPHDGLLETHDVDNSLKDKLKCLVFIPIISRTYCDPKSFAWDKEFLEFLKISEAGPSPNGGHGVGLKVKLPNGNTGSRVLPIRIHELDAHDRQSIESALKGPLRAIDFTYKAAGINRPLLPTDDEAVKGSGQASYRDHINKTANAISDIIAGLQGNSRAPALSSLTTASVSSTNSPFSVERKNWRFRTPIVGIRSVSLVALVILLLTLSFIHFSETPADSRVYRSTILPPEKTRFSTNPNGNLALSPDGTSLAFVTTDSTGNSLLWVRSLSTLEARALKGTDGAFLPFWSPDSRSIAFFADRKLKRVDVSGGVPLILCEAPVGRGGTWGKEGVIVFNRDANGPLWRVPASGGNASALLKLDTSRIEASHRWPCFLPDGQHFFYTSRIYWSGVSEDDAIFLASLDTTFVPRLIANASSNTAYADGYLLFVRQQTLMAQPFDAAGLQTSGEAFPIAEKLHFEYATSHGSFSVSENGHLVFQQGTGKSGAKLNWRDRSGKLISSVRQAENVSPQLRISPDEERIAVASQDVWLYTAPLDTWTRFTFGAAIDRSPIWSPDGKKIVFASGRNKRFELFQRASNGEGDEVLLLTSDESKIPSDWSQDGKYIAYYTLEPSDIWILPLSSSGEQKPFAYLKTEFNETRATFSPDGKWIAYQSDESGRDEIYIHPFRGQGGKWQVTNAGGTRPRWRGDGKELFFIDPDFRLMSAEITLGTSSVQVGTVQTIFDMGSSQTASSTNRDLYDAARNGQRFLMESDPGTEIPVTLVVNWTEEIHN